MRSWNAPTRSQAVAGRLLVLVCALGFLVGSVGPAWADWFDDLDLSLAPGGLAESVRLPVPGSTNGSLGGVVPYATLGGTALMGDAAAPIGPDRYQGLAGPPAARLDVGAGLSVRLFERLRVFGEYRLFQVRPERGSAPEGPKRDSDGPALRAGFSVPF